MQVYTTPAKAGHNAGVALPSSARASTSNGMQSALYEPSPASTYGDTVAGESPATPYHIDDYGKFMGSSTAVLPSERSLHVNV